jgi:hypothetical protein
VQSARAQLAWRSHAQHCSCCLTFEIQSPPYLSNLHVARFQTDDAVNHPETPIYDLARPLNITAARVRNLILNWQLRTAAAITDLSARLVAALQKTRFSKDETLLTFGTENPLLKEAIVARLKRKGIFF